MSLHEERAREREEQRGGKIAESPRRERERKEARNSMQRKNAGIVALPQRAGQARRIKKEKKEVAGEREKSTSDIAYLSGIPSSTGVYNKN